MPTFPPTEGSSLLHGTFPQTYSTLPMPLQSPGPLLPTPDQSLCKHMSLAWKTATNSAKTVSQPSHITHIGFRIFSSLPAVFLGLLLNILDHVSYGMILFPAGTIFDGFGPMGMSLFFLHVYYPLCPWVFSDPYCHHRIIITQLIFTFGGSKFTGGSSSMMIAVVVCCPQSLPSLPFSQKMTLNCLPPP